VILPGRISLLHDLPPIPEIQTRDGACAAHAVVTLLEYLTECRTRLSASFLFAAMRLKVRAWLERNVDAVGRGERGDADFEHVFRDDLAGLRCVLAENSADSAAGRRFLELFLKRAGDVFGQARGCPVRFASEALVEFGVCRHALWPEGGDPGTETFAAEAEEFPDEVRADARRRRLANGLDFLPEPGNVESVKAVLAGANGNRRMPVVLALDGQTGHGAHAVLAVGYRDDASQPGGGFFMVRDGSGERRPARLPYDDVAKRCTEAATVFQLQVDYAGDGYGGFKTRRRIRLAAGCLALVAALGIGLAGFHAWRTSPAVLDAPFQWLAHPDCVVERIRVVADATYGSCMADVPSIRYYAFREEYWPRVDASLTSNGVARAVAGAPDILMLFARNTSKRCTPAEKEAVARYLESGGNVFAFICDCNRTLMADLLAPYGIKIQGISWKPPLKATAPVLRDAQTDGYSWFRVTEMSDDWHPLVVVDDASMAPVMAFRRVGKGKLFCAAQQQIGGNRRRVKNSGWWSELMFACAADSHTAVTGSK